MKNLLLTLALLTSASAFASVEVSEATQKTFDNVHLYEHDSRGVVVKIDYRKFRGCFNGIGYSLLNNGKSLSQATKIVIEKEFRPVPAVVCSPNMMRIIQGGTRFVLTPRFSKYVSTSLMMTEGLKLEVESVKEMGKNFNTFTGTLVTGLMAIGGETTGTAIKTESGLIELILDAEQREMLQYLNKKEVIVVGELIELRGVEIPFRKAIKVKILEANNLPRF